MSRPILLTEDLIEQATAEFKTGLKNFRMTDGKLVYNKTFTYKDEEKAIVLFTPAAYLKMASLIYSFDSEVAWHGVGERVEGEDATFLIYDILVYPQKVTGSFVDMDTGAYAQWINDNITDERFNHIVMQGHSHVNMAPNPSGTDLKHQSDILDMVSKNKFYIFMIWNKKLERTIKIYDMKNNTLYENDDIVCQVSREGFDLQEFLEDAKKLVEKKAATYNYGNQYNGYPYNTGTNNSKVTDISSASKPTPPASSSATTSPTTSQAASSTSGVKPKEKPKTPEYGSGWKGRGSEDMDEHAGGFMNKDIPST